MSSGKRITAIRFLRYGISGRIEEAATVCSREVRSEDSWSDDVVLEIMRLALTWSGLRNKLMVANL